MVSKVKSAMKATMDLRSQTYAISSASCLAVVVLRQGVWELWWQAVSGEMTIASYWEHECPAARAKPTFAACCTAWCRMMRSSFPGERERESLSVRLSDGLRIVEQVDLSGLVMGTTRQKSGARNRRQGLWI
jgi:hypothetical protein